MREQVELPVTCTCIFTVSTPPHLEAPEQLIASPSAVLDKMTCVAEHPLPAAWHPMIAPLLFVTEVGKDPGVGACAHVPLMLTWHLWMMPSSVLKNSGKFPGQEAAAAVQPIRLTPSGVKRERPRR
jgi:hypothetical protein